jgi:hypothetical protein
MIEGEFEARLPRAGKIHLGIKEKSEKSGAEYPRETEYFVMPFADFPEAEGLFGEKPTWLPVVLPLDDTDKVAATAFKRYGRSGLLCTGNGQVAVRRRDDEDGPGMDWDDMPCPRPGACDFAQDSKGRTVCKRITHIHLMIPELTYNGTFQIDTTSSNTVQSLIDNIFMQRAVAGTASMVLLVARREPTKMHGRTFYPIRFFRPNPGQERAILKKFPRTARFLVQFANRARGHVEVTPPAVGEVPTHLIPDGDTVPPLPDEGDLGNGDGTWTCQGCSQVLIDSVEVCPDCAKGDAANADKGVDACPKCFGNWPDRGGCPECGDAALEGELTDDDKYEKFRVAFRVATEGTKRRCTSKQFENFLEWVDPMADAVWEQEDKVVDLVRRFLASGDSVGIRRPAPATDEASQAADEAEAEPEGDAGAEAEAATASAEPCEGAPLIDGAFD